MDIGFFINYKNVIVQLPVNPESVNVNYSGNNATMEVVKLGDINLLKDKKLAEIEFESFFPNGDWFPAVRTRGNFEKPTFYKNFFRGIMEDKKPCRLIITGIDINMQVAVEQFDWYHQGGDHEDAYYSIKFKEYREFRITEIAIDPSLRRPAPPRQSPPKPQLPIAPVQITKGCDVILNGRVHYDSYGSRPGKTFSNYRGKVNFINLKGSHPYHVTTPSGGWLGWVTKGSVVLV